MAAVSGKGKPTQTKGKAPAKPEPKKTETKTAPAKAAPAKVPAVPAKSGGGKGGLPANASAMRAEMRANASAGLASSAQDFAIPFLYIAQANSPQLKKQDGKYIKDMSQGDIFNNVSGDFWPCSDGESAGPIVLPVAFQRKYIRWTPRDSGGGLVSVHTVEEGMELLRTTTKDERRRDTFDNGDILANTAEHYVMILMPDGRKVRAVVAMTSTQLKKSKQWNTMMGELMVDDGSGEGLFNPPTYTQLYQLSTGPESNNDGEWHGWIIRRHEAEWIGNPDLDLSDYSVSAEDIGSLYAAAKAFSESIAKGEGNVDYGRADSAGAGAMDGGAGGKDEGSF